MKFDCCGTEDEEKRDGGGGDLKVGLTQRPPARAGVLNRAEQLAGHRAWNSSAWLRAAVTCCHFKQRVRVSGGRNAEEREGGILLNKRESRRVEEEMVWSD